MNGSTFDVAPDKLSKTIHRTNEALKDLIHANIVLENEEHKLGYIKKYKSNVNEAQANLIVD